MTLAGIAVAQDDIEFMRLSDLDGSGVASSANQITPRSGIVVGASSSSATGVNTQEPVAWNAEGAPMALGSLPMGGLTGTAYSASNLAQRIVGASSSGLSGVNSTEAFLWMRPPTEDDDPVLMGLGFLDGGSDRSVAYAINSGGTTVVGASSSATSGSSGDEAFYWTVADGMVPLGFLASSPSSPKRSEARGISGTGLVIVGFSTSDNVGINDAEAFRWRVIDEQPVMEGLPDLDGGGDSSRANGVSEDGFVIVGGSSSMNSGSNSFEACRWTAIDEDNVVLEGLGDLPGGVFDSQALAASSSGHVIVGTATSSRGSEAFVYDDEKGMRALFDIVEASGIDLGSWRLTAATGVSADGLIVVGTGINPSGVSEGWVITLPEPTGFALGMAALGTLAALRARRRPIARRR